MDFDDPKQLAVFFDVHSGLPREGPGCFDSTKRALEMVGPLPAEPRVLDVGCGPGTQTMDLAALLPTAHITAVDFHPPYIEEVNKRAAAKGVADRVTASVGDMAKLDFAPQSFDLIWCEGAAYIMGVENAFRAWKPLLVPGGKLALTEAVWLRDDPPAPVRACWQEYPDMKDIAFNRHLVEKCGYKLLGDFVLPKSAWLDEYYGPMQARLDAITEKYRDDPVAQDVLAESQEEIDVYRKYSDYYGYIFLVMAVKPISPLS